MLDLLTLGGPKFPGEKSPPVPGPAVLRTMPALGAFAALVALFALRFLNPIM